MDSNAPKPKTVDDYILSSPANVRPILQRIREVARKAAPNAEERMSYDMPALFENGVLIYFAAFKKHIGIYPPVHDETLKQEVARFAGPKGNLQFPLSEPIPFELIARIVEVRLAENREHKAAKPAKAKKEKRSPQ